MNLCLKRKRPLINSVEIEEISIRKWYRKSTPLCAVLDCVKLNVRLCGNLHDVQTSFVKNVIWLKS
jgi:hypothetical protein